LREVSGGKHVEKTKENRIPKKSLKPKERESQSGRIVRSKEKISKGKARGALYRWVGWGRKSILLEVTQAMPARLKPKLV
jgi:hypothetical protein